MSPTDMSATGTSSGGPAANAAGISGPNATPGQTRSGAPRLLGEALAALAFYALAVPWLLRPWFGSAGLLPHSPGPIGAMANADLLLNLWILAWAAWSALHDPSHLLDGNIYHPLPGAILGSENMLAHLPLTAPLLALTGDALAMFEGFLVESFALAGLGMFLYVRHHTGSFAAALLAGAAYTFTPLRVKTLPQPQYLGTAWLPAALLAIDLWFERGQRRWLLGLAASLALQALSCVYLGFFTFIAVPVYAATRLLGAPRRWRDGAGVLLATALASLALLPTALPYLAARGQGRIPSFPSEWIRAFSWMPWQYVSLEFVGRAGPVTLLVVAIGLVGRRFGQPTVRPRSDGRVDGGQLLSPALALASVAVVGVVLSAGPDLLLPGGSVLPLPYKLLHAWVPGFSSMRGPVRFSLLVASMLAALAGLLAAPLLHRLRPAGRLLVAAALALACIWRAAPHPAPVATSGLGASAAAAHRWLARHAAGEAVLEIPGPTGADDPIGNLRNARAMVASTLGFWPLLNGYTAYPPPAAGLIAAAVRDLPDAEALDRLVALTQLRWILVRTDALTAPETARWTTPLPRRLEAVETFGGDRILRVTDDGTRADPDLAVKLARRSAVLHDDTLEGTTRSPLAAACRRNIELADVVVPERLSLIPVAVRVPLTIVNNSDCTLPGADARPEGLVVLRHRWHGPDGRVVPTRLESRLYFDVPAHSRRAASLLLLPPPAARGRWRLEIALEQTGVDQPLAQSFAGVEIGPPPSPGP